MLKIYGYPEDVNRCVGCVSAKRLCDAKKIPYEFISIADKVNQEGPVIKEEIRKELEQKLGTTRLSAPIIFEDDKHIGGFNELRTHLMKK